MAREINIPDRIIGLNNSEVQKNRADFGHNFQTHKAKYKWWLGIIDILKEPMLLLLIAVTVIYFILGENQEAYFMLAAIIAVSSISFYQDNRSRKAIEALEKLTEPLSTVYREGLAIKIPTKEIVINDLVIVEEGNTINADGIIVHSNDFSVNESTLTGEAYSVFKSEKTEDNKVLSGTLVASGLAIYKVTAIGAQTKIGQLGSSLLEAKETPTPLQLQIERFVKGMAIIGITVFLLVWGVYFFNTRDLLNSLLKGLTLAMSILPEEIPVAFTTFMALGSWRLLKEGIIIKKIRTVETLGSATIICTDKTGTITENKMNLQSVYAFATGQLYAKDSWYEPAAQKVIEIAMWASEPVPFDPMEKTLHAQYEKLTNEDLRKSFSLVQEYPLEGKPPLMTHVFENEEGQRIIAAKGGTETLLNACGLSAEQKEEVALILQQLASQGYRILGVAESHFDADEYPKNQLDFSFTFIGLIVFYDPPKANIQSVFQQFYEAGIVVKVITGDNSLTTQSIATSAGLKNTQQAIEGQEIMKMDEHHRLETIHKHTLFTRMFPEAKLAVITTLKNDGQLVAMVGDGVNDGPALQSAHIGIAMGKKGTEIAKNAADMILVDDDLSKMIVAVAAGRRIYSNIKKAVQYIVSIHIPIILTVSLPLFLGWVYTDIFTPVHVIFLEMIMGPMCSIVYENEPAEKNSMTQPPRQLGKTFLSLKEMGLSVIQGLVITCGVLFVYQLTVQNEGTETLTRTMVFTTLVFSNIILSLVNRSFYYSVFSTLKNRNGMMVFMNGLTLFCLAMIVYQPEIANFFKVVPLNGYHILLCGFISGLSVLWIEVYKWFKRQNKVFQ
ncbi:cation-translocating P-type ATPase [Flavobacterium sp. UMI-01]|uniref:cation-translocating P-type ATPase n=1 Tax=Flavobacterium sp. UMI-01 TaxID=1441053 RepID=UPI001C7E1C4A|nr:cation-translocating P-type ATPase [Flavobacterium sp. UMI-01]GIZ08123.1 ATPase [Flavobacterium sp. UMI-01]